LVTTRLRRAIVSLAVAVVTAQALCADAAAARTSEQELAARYVPVVALKTQRRLCGKGEAYRPVLVDVVLGRADVSLFDGSGGRYRRVRRGPTAADLFAGPAEHYVDLPGHPVTGACSYEHWFKRIGASAPNAVYAHVARERGRPGRLALQYWLYYVFNDFNDKHESDWEMIQLHFDANTVEEALRRPPTEVLYSQHEGAERAGWNDDKLEKVGRTHVVTYPGAGSHANYFRHALWLGRSAAEGLGCDDSTAPSTRVNPRAVVLPARGRENTSFAWITFEGRWGQRERGFNNGPQGPNAKLQWDLPFTWAESVERDQSFNIGRTEHAGVDASAFFCSGVTAASDLLDAIYASTWTAVAALVALLALLVLAAIGTRWRPAPVRPLEQRRAAGQILRVSVDVYRLDWRTLFVISALALPLAFLGALALHLLLDLGWGQELVRTVGREALLTVHVYALALAAVQVAILGLAVAATAVVVGSLRLGEERVGTMGAYRLAADHAGSLAGVLLRVAGIPLLLGTTIVGLPVAIWYFGRTAVALPACVIEGLGARAAIKRSKQVVGRQFWRVSALTTLIGAAALLVGPLVGAVVLLETDLGVLQANLLGLVVTAALMPLVGIVVTLLFFDLRARQREAQVGAQPAPASG
jgi:hypothetical protein